MFRVDASVAIGAGHLMRCLALADCLRIHGAASHFICRPDQADLTGLIREHGHAVLLLAPAEDAADLALDAQQTCETIGSSAADWLVVDHYQLDREWESAVGMRVRKLLAIDDLGRPHRCDVLLDQNFARSAHSRYENRLETSCVQLLGPEFALLRPEFARLRPAALARRTGALQRVLISMGGTDAENETGKALEGLAAHRRSDWHVDVVIGVGNPHRQKLSEACGAIPGATLHVQAANMADLMVAADCAIGAGGSTTWERCCLGLPTLATVLSADQKGATEALAELGAQLSLGEARQLTADDYARALGDLSAERLAGLSAAAARICDGLGAQRVVQHMQ